MERRYGNAVRQYVLTRSLTDMNRVKQLARELTGRGGTLPDVVVRSDDPKDTKRAQENINAALAGKPVPPAGPSLAEQVSQLP